MRILLLALIACAAPAFAADPPRPSTANANVHVLAPMKIAGLDRDRVIRLYLPPGYASSDKRYPVIYFHDGQNLFDDATSFVGEWGVDETLDALAAEGLEFIAVGIDHGAEKRINELTPWLQAKFGPAQGIEYLEFVVKQVKPAIDAQYRTLPDRAHTTVAGSSMGGVMSHYALYKYPQVFGKALVFSPAYWTGLALPFDYTLGRDLPPGTRYYAVTGSKEGAEALQDLRHMTAVMRANADPDVALHVEEREGAEHNEKFWRAELPQALRWLAADP
jgi:predicted alpha/beta superfamily hydrolase